MSVKALAVIGESLVAGTYYGGVWKTTLSDLFASLTTFPVNSGWNLISVPREPPDRNTSTLLPGASPGTVYRYATGSFRQATTMLTGEGYWALFDSAGTNTISGTPTAAVSITVGTGNRWVLFGSVTSSVPASALTSDPVGAITPGTLFGWNGSAYIQPMTIEPGRGYWVYVNAPCTLKISQPGSHLVGEAGRHSGTPVRPGSTRPESSNK